MSNDSKSKLLTSALEEFAKNGFFGTSTRDIAAKANINISSILYYFGGKKGIYTAALQNIVNTINELTSDITDQYQQTIKKPNPKAAKKLLKDFMQTFMMITCSESLSPEMKKIFLSEYSCPSDEFALLYNELIRPFHDKIANLLHIASDKKIDLKDCYFYVITIFSTLFVFISREEAIYQIMEWDNPNEKVLNKLLDYINNQIDFILSASSKKQKTKSIK